MSRSKRIMLVEDEFLIAMSLEDELKRKGFDVLAHVTSGEKAIEAARHQELNVILMDIRLAGRIDGLEAARQIRVFSSIPIVFMTGYSSPEMIMEAEKLNPLAYLPKPISVPQLKSIIDSYFSPH